MKQRITTLLLSILLVAFTAAAEPVPQAPVTLPAVADSTALQSTCSHAHPHRCNPDSLWTRANTAYINNDFRCAVRLYNRILDEGLHSAKLYYNLGNAHFKEGHIGAAVLNYERALRLDPANEDIRHNLRIARLQTRDRIEPLPEFFLYEWLRAVRQTLSGTAWSVLALLFLAAMLAAGLLYLLARRLSLRKAGFYTTLALLLCFAVSLGFAIVDRREALQRDAAIVMHHTVAVKSSPQPSATDLFLLHEGTRVEIDAQHEGWCEVRIADGKKGWMEASKLEII